DGMHWSISDGWRPVGDGILWSTTTLTGAGPWNWEIPAGNLPSSWAEGEEYWVVSRAKDAAANQESVFSVGVDSNTFIYDTTEPESNVTYPTADVNTEPELQGTCSDLAPGDVVEVQYRIRTQGNKYWDENASGWGASGDEYWNTATLSPGATSWSENIGTWYDELTYYLNSKAKDNAGNYETSFSTVSFTYDSVDPVSVSTTPSNQSYQTLSYIGGTAGDGAFGSGVVEVKIEVADITENSTWYWNGPGPKWQDGLQEWLSVSAWSDPDWSYTDLNDSFWDLRGSGHKFRIQTRSKDSALNYEIPDNDIYFIYDTDEPFSVSIGPVDTASYSFDSGVAPLSGTANDEPNLGLPRSGNAGIDYVDIAIEDKSSGKNWTGSSWTVTSPYWITTAGTTDWDYTFSTSALTSDRDYQVTVRAKDNVDLYEVAPTTTVFTFDNIAPTSSVSAPAGNTYYGTNNLSPFSGSVNDTGTGVDRTELWIKWASTSPVKYWNATTDSWGSETWEDISSTGWSCNIATSYFRSGDKYLIKTRGVDNTLYDENEENGALKSATTFYFDNIKPVSVVTYPADGNQYVIIDKVQGTASDDNSGINPAGVKVTEIAIQIDPGTSGNWWDGASDINSWNSGSEVWISSTSWSDPNWEVAIPTTIWKSGHEYRVKSRATDKVPGAGVNEEAPSSIIDFEIDFAAPQAEITTPEEGKYYSSLPKIEGTSSDDYAGIAGVELTIRDIAAGQYFQAPGWGGKTWLQADAVNAPFGSTAEDWEYTNASWQTSGKRYEVKVRAYDVYGNTEPEHGYNFVIDKQKPDTLTTSPSDNGVRKTLSKIEGTSSDDYGVLFSTVNNMEITIRDITRGTTFWNNNSWQDSLLWIDASTLTDTTWEYNMSNWTTGHKYALSSKGYDKAVPNPNIETAITTTTFIYDKSEPDSFVVIPAENDTLQDLTQISGTANDEPDDPSLYNVGLATVGVKIRDLIDGGDDKYWTGTVWSTDTINYIEVTGTDSWTYGGLSGSGWTTNHKYEINVKACDNVPNEEMVISTRSFIIDRSSPTAEVTTPADGSNLASRPASISGTARDDLSLDYKATIDENKVWVSVYDVDKSSYWNESSKVWEEGATPYWNPADSVDSPNGPNWQMDIDTNCWTDTHQYSLKSKVSDKAGNLTQSSLNTFYYDETPPLSFM
ncbi:MAG: hypothetical protein PF545_02655, partial [Elusimicrobia bacterium]|nr:hypothetical protein [Elusimicrobiota bacterium]